MFTDDAWSVIATPLPPPWFSPSPDGGSFFLHDTQSRLRSGEAIVPEGWARRLGIDDPAVWRAWWKHLSRMRLSLPDEANTAHLLSLGGLHGADHFVFDDPDRPWAADRRRSLCQQEPESLLHLFASCSVSEAIWRCLSGASAAPPPSLSDLVCPRPVPPASVTSDRPRLVHSVWRLRNRRRYGHQDPEPLELAEVEGEFRFGGFSR
jgi:hypothetical protein